MNFWIAYGIKEAVVLAQTFMLTPALPDKLKQSLEQFIIAGLTVLAQL